MVLWSGLFGVREKQKGLGGEYKKTKLHRGRQANIPEGEAISQGLACTLPQSGAECSPSGNHLEKENSLLKCRGKKQACLRGEAFLKRGRRQAHSERRGAIGKAASSPGLGPSIRPAAVACWQPGGQVAEPDQSKVGPEVLHSSGPSRTGVQCLNQTPGSTYLATAVSLCFMFPFCPLSPPSGVQRYHQVLREGETAETLPTQPVQVSLLWNLWQSVKTGHREESTLATEDSRNHLGQNLSFLCFIYLFPPPHSQLTTFTQPPRPVP